MDRPLRRAGPPQLVHSHGGDDDARPCRGDVNVPKDGRITNVTVAKPSPVDAFTLSARNTILATDPTLPLPPEYPDDKAFFTVTFFFNENPGAP